MELSRWSQRRSGSARGRRREALLLLSGSLQRRFRGDQFEQGLCHGGLLQVMSRRARRPNPRPSLEEGVCRVWMPPGRRTLSRFLFWSAVWHRAP